MILVFLLQHFAFVCNVERMNKIRREGIKKEKRKKKTVTEGNKYTWTERNKKRI
jgi:hypothetical protein